jgi:hypothetical protein
MISLRTPAELRLAASFLNQLADLRGETEEDDLCKRVDQLCAKEPAFDDLTSALIASKKDWLASHQNTLAIHEAFSEPTPPEVQEAVAEQAQALVNVTAALSVAVESPTPTLEQVRARLLEISSTKRDAVMALIASFGKKSLSEIPAEKFGEVLQKAESL